ncbi:MAG TPA: outer membrane lipoprotein-sorting protein [Verrucomicrobiae bacterium]|nr:outer membrane lipoprotein-sorting protein [Verrucomicrobiae bacterium]
MLLTLLAFAQPKSELAPPPPIPPAEGERQAHELLDRLLAQKPDQSLTNTGTLTIRDAQGQQRTISARFDIAVAPTHWTSVYVAAPAPTFGGEEFAVLHYDLTNQYRLVLGTNRQARSLTGDQLMVPFAQSDFWLADLGLEFLHWPAQRIVKKQMRKNLFCDVLQSANPHPAPGAYSRVVTWIAANRPDEIIVVHADAYDFAGKLLKEFDPKRVEKINGVWQLEAMEIRNRQTGSRTRIDFNLEK